MAVSSVTFVSYDEKTQTLVVGFPERKASYAYTGISPEVADGMRWASAVGVSAGQYFQNWIKDHPGTRLK